MVRARVRDCREGDPLPAEIIARLAHVVECHGEVEACRILEVPKQTLARCLAGLGLRQCTRLYAISRLKAYDAHRAENA